MLNTLHQVVPQLETGSRSAWDSGHMTGSAEVIPGDPMALLLPACRQTRTWFSFLLTRALVGADSLSGLTLRLPFSGCARLRPCCGLPVLLEQSPLSG
jgi:hypothetical protein